MTRRVALLSIGLVALSGLALLVLTAPSYLAQSGFPLDDAWIHAVYGRELARSGMLAYNPETPATGSTAPLWSAVFALAHLLTDRVGVLVMLIKLFGFALHVATAMLVYLVLEGADARGTMRLAGALLVAFHPDLLSAAVSGMEVPLAACCAAGLWYAASHARWISYALLAATAVFARPELSVVAVCLPLLGLRYRRGAARQTLAAALGVGAALAAMALRNVAVSGRPLPATFYAKVGGGPALSEAFALGFRGLFGELPIVDSSILLTLLIVLSIAVLSRRWMRAGLVDAACAFGSGLAYCLVSFALIAPIDPPAFYHQRYVLPALPLLIGPAPVLLDGLIGAWLPTAFRLPARAVFLSLCVVSLLIAAPPRFAHLASDAHNIDDVQVQIGRSLAAAGPGDVVWAVDAGAVRYFGNAFVVDMIGLNTPQIVGPDAPAFARAHPPQYLEIVPGWSGVDDGAARALAAVRYHPSTPYTVTSFAPMQDHYLARCDAAAGPVQYSVGARSFALVCGAAADAGAVTSPRPW
jgi:hypothetical protein